MVLSPAGSSKAVRVMMEKSALSDPPSRFVVAQVRGSVLRERSTDPPLICAVVTALPEVFLWLSYTVPPFTVNVVTV